MLRSVLILVFVLFGPVARAGNDVMAQAAGKWYGAIGDQGLHYEWLSDDHADGTTRIRFHDCQSREETIEVGTWYMTDSLLVTQTVREDDPGRGPITRSYLIEARGQDYIRYRDLRSDKVFEAHRMAPDFELPGCDVTS